MESIWKSGMQSQASRDAQMRARVAETTISAQKVVDAFHQPDIPISSNFHEKRVTAGPMHGYSLAELKLTTAGTPSTFASANYYNLKAKQRRDELLAKFSEEKEQL